MIKPLNKYNFHFKLIEKLCISYIRRKENRIVKLFPADLSSIYNRIHSTSWIYMEPKDVPYASELLRVQSQLENHWIGRLYSILKEYELEVKSLPISWLKDDRLRIG